ncbi:MAG: 2-amino-4-hydroxy-6-hydroxymethyldihydropteridine diphosphokinase [Bacteroidales bacterium]|nr:2-amino-4-hydroxy-6-hydroxymethyldihydropteridine diphosphokinase [Bacteroidales bacterium]
MKKYHDVILSIGSNIEPNVNIPNSWQSISKFVGRIKRCSRLYITEPWGYDSRRAFVNYCCRTMTTLSPIELLYVIKKIEQKSGRNSLKCGVYDDRELDIDILFYDDMIYLSRNLIIPHPYIHLRKFVLLPLHEIAPQFIHPVFRKTIRELLAMCPDTHVVKESEILSL